MSGRFLFPVALLILAACVREADVLNRPPVSVQESSDGLDRMMLDAKSSSDPDGNKLTYAWSAESDDISIIDADKAQAYFKLPPDVGTSEVAITLKVNDGRLESSSTSQVTIPALTQSRAFGLGKEMINEVSNNVSYEWYSDQGNSGTWAGVNCGPTSVTMAIKWADENFTGTPEDARNTYRSTGGWWYTSDIINYLSLKGVSAGTIALTSMKDLQDELDEGHIAILCLDMSYVSRGMDAEYHRDKFYAADSRGWGHFIVIKGYQQVDDHIFFEAYDPFSFDSRYADQTIKGKNRYYLSEDLNAATNIWWDYAIVIGADVSNSGRWGLLPGSVPDMPGR